LAESLELWALRREKLLELLDVKAAREARDIARQCVLLAAKLERPFDHADCDRAWRSIRLRALGLLARSRSTSMIANDREAGSGERPSGIRRAPSVELALELAAEDVA
jgi:hypothetical protein